MDIKGIVEELKSIDGELRRIRLSTKKLRDRKVELEDVISKYCKDRELPGVKYKDTAILSESKMKRNYKKKTDKEEDAKNVLRGHGVTDSSRVLEELLEAYRGEKSEVSSLRIKKIIK
jgi:hypothetical protein